MVHTKKGHLLAIHSQAKYPYLSYRARFSYFARMFRLSSAFSWFVHFIEFCLQSQVSQVGTSFLTFFCFGRPETSSSSLSMSSLRVPLVLAPLIRSSSRSSFIVKTSVSVPTWTSPITSWSENTVVAAPSVAIFTFLSFFADFLLTSFRVSSSTSKTSCCRNTKSQYAEFIIFVKSGPL